MSESLQDSPTSFKALVFGEAVKETLCECGKIMTASTSRKHRE